jgi:hypothetical protein
MKRIVLLPLLFLIAVAAYPCDQPAILYQPQNVTIQSGSSATLSVVAASGEVLHYQWYHGPAGITTQPVGTDSPAFNTGPLAVSAQYWVRVTTQTCCTGTFSATATVTVSCNRCARYRPRAEVDIATLIAGGSYTGERISWETTR